jgi:hypothetical protein
VTSRSLIVLVGFLTLLGAGADEAWARAGGGGSRGSRSYSAPARPAPMSPSSPAAPGSLIDYTVDAAGAVVAGSRTGPERFEEFWTFTRPVGPNTWVLTAIQTG